MEKTVRSMQGYTGLKPETSTKAFTRRVRRDSLPAVLISLAMLGASFWLEPDPRGYGTHQRLFMPPCFFHLLTGEPCPFCGLTTGFTYLARGQLVAAAHSNLLAPPAFALVILALLGGLFGLVTGRSWIPEWIRYPWINKVALAMIGLFWVANLCLHHWPVRLP